GRGGSESDSERVRVVPNSVYDPLWPTTPQDIDAVELRQSQAHLSERPSQARKLDPLIARTADPDIQRADSHAATVTPRADRWATSTSATLGLARLLAGPVPRLNTKPRCSPAPRNAPPDPPALGASSRRGNRMDTNSRPPSPAPGMPGLRRKLHSVGSFLADTGNDLAAEIADVIIGEAGV